MDILEQSEKDKTIDDYVSLVTVCARRVDAATDARLTDARMQMVMAPLCTGVPIGQKSVPAAAAATFSAADKQT